MQLPRTRSGLFALLILALAAGLLAAEDATVVGGDLGAALDRAVQRMEEEMTDGPSWNRELTLRLLHAETQSLLGLSVENASSQMEIGLEERH